MIDKFGAQQVKNVKFGSDTRCIHLAAYKGQPSIITFLIEKGVNVDIKDNKDDTPLRWAILDEKYSAITTLVKAGASLEKAKMGKLSDYSFNKSMKEDKTKAAIAKGRKQRLAGEKEIEKK